MIAYQPGAVPRLFVGPGAVDRLPEIVGGLGGTCALLAARTVNRWHVLRSAS